MSMARRWLIVTLLAAWPAAAAFASPASEAAFAEGQTLVAADKLPEAIQKFEAAVAADPSFATAWYWLAKVRRKANQCTGAISAYRHYAALAPDEPEPYYGLGLCLRDTGDRPGAIEALKRYVATEKRPSSEQWVAKARGVIAELGASGAPAAAIADSKPPAKAPEAIADSKPPTKAPVGPAAQAANAAYLEAQSLRDHGHIDEAVAKFRQAIAADPKQMAARAALGELLLKVHRDDEAIEVFHAALDKNPTYPLAWYELAFLFRARGRAADAVDAYQRYIKLRPGDPDAYYGLGRALESLGRGPEARKAYESYLAMEKRPSEKHWVDAAQTEIQALSAAH